MYSDVSTLLSPDVDECMVANLCPGQLCLNSPGSYTCRSCGAGLRLSEDGYGCEGKLTTLTRNIKPPGTVKAVNALNVGPKFH